MIVDYYRGLAEGRSEPDKILVVSRSMYGLTEKAVEAALAEIRRLGYRPAYYRFNELEYSSPAENNWRSDRLESDYHSFINV